MKETLLIALSTAFLMSAPVSASPHALGSYNLIQHGQSKAQIRKIMGDPVGTEVDGGHEAWKYCTKVAKTNRFVIVYFTDSRVEKWTTHTKKADHKCTAQFEPANWDEPGSPSPPAAKMRTYH